ncbi:hypothetical protein JCM10908_004059 [Rhodotorula pacifica]|uniref:Mdm10p n=1 Tax=Rhodotorula pacifica TaxID=1495444 RepID=UPI00316C3EBE
MSQHAQYLVREFLQATQWNAWDNYYGTLTQPSRQLLDFAVPLGAVLTTASRPTRSLAPSLTLSSLVPTLEQGTQPTYPPTPAPTLEAPVNPLLAGQLSYLFTSVDLDHRSSKRAATGRDRVDFKDVVQSYPLGELPVRPDLREDARPTWRAGQRTDSHDYLLYGRLYAPTPRLDALYIRRISPTLQGLVSLITVPSPPPPPTLTWESGDPTASLSASTIAASASAGPTSGPLARLSELELKLQHDTGRWSTEYSYAVGDGMWGVRGLYNFGRWGDPGLANAPLPVPPLAGGAGPLEQSEQDVSVPPSTDASTSTMFGSSGGQDETPTGLKGRWSAGGEIYFSAQERSAGVSTALRFVTIPESADGPPNQPPTYVTATLNPIMGQLSTAYAVQAGRDTRFASRFDFNLYSYESELTFGGEWFQRRTPSAAYKGKAAADQAAPDTEFDAFGRGADDEDMRKRRLNNDAEDEVLSVLKVRASTSSDLAMLWEGRMGDFIVSAGFVADLRLATRSRGRISPIRSVGLGVSYWG